MVNLLANVRAHTPEGTPALIHLDQDDARVLLEITDQGPGMPPEQVAQAFDRFTRGSSERATGGPGSAWRS